MTFVAWGLFAHTNKRLTILELKDCDASIIKSRSEKRKQDKLQIDLVREQDLSNKRRISTDQRIQIDAMNLQKSHDDDRKRETLIVGLSIQESALA